MYEIWKYALELQDITRGKMPNGPVLKAGLQKGQLFIWLQADVDGPRTYRTFRVFGTGQPLGSTGGLFHIDTVIDEDEGVVWHVFEEV